MSTYLDRLKQLDGEKYFHNTPDTIPTKPSKAPFVGFDGTGTGHIEKIIDDVVIDAIPETDCLDTLAKDYAELKTCIIELCRIVEHTEEDKANMLAACPKLYPFQVAKQRDYFRQQVERATAGKYWNYQTTH